MIAPGQRVFIHTRNNGLVKAVFGWPAIHTRLSTPDKENSPKVENLCLDCGARSRQEVEALGIKVGNVVTYQDGFDELANDYYKRFRQEVRECGSFFWVPSFGVPISVMTQP